MTSVGLAVTLIGLTTMVLAASGMVSSRKGKGRGRWAGKHVYITGGSQGLGLAVGKQVAQEGAHVTLVARDERKLSGAAEEIRALLVDGSTVKIATESADLTEAAQARSALERACDRHGGRAPDVVFCCAGASRPGFFLEQDAALFRQCLDTIYSTALYTTHAAAQKMAEQGRGGEIILTSSVLGFFGFVGYASYAPAKFAIRGLAETLRAELTMHGISIRCYFPATILSPGYDEENKTKPAITREIEGTDEGQTPAMCAAKLIKGVERGDFFITSDFIGDVLRSLTKGVVPGNSWIFDPIFAALGNIIFPIWRRITDRQTARYGRKHVNLDH